MATVLLLLLGVLLMDVYQRGSQLQRMWIENIKNNVFSMCVSVHGQHTSNLCTHQVAINTMAEDPAESLFVKELMSMVRLHIWGFTCGAPSSTSSHNLLAHTPYLATYIGVYPRSFNSCSTSNKQHGRRTRPQPHASGSG